MVDILLNAISLQASGIGKQCTIDTIDQYLTRRRRAPQDQYLPIESGVLASLELESLASVPHGGHE